jgi:hypothetical protein
MSASTQACLLLLLWTSLQVPSGAPIDRQPFRYSRKIHAMPEGLVALRLDAAVLAHSRPDLADLRIIDVNDHQIPYLLETRPGTFSVDLPPLRTDKPPSVRQSLYRLELPFENLPRSKLVLTTSERVFQRHVLVQIERAPRDSRSEPTSESVAVGEWRHNDPSTPAPPLSLDLRSSLGAASLSLIIDEGDNRPLELGPSQLELPDYRLRFFNPRDGQLTLLYGHDALSAPRYDLELMASQLMDASARDIGLAPEVAAAGPEESSVPTYVFWVALVLAVAVVLMLLVRLIRSAEV